MASCPQCESTGLRHTLLAEHLPAHGCDACSGILLSLVAYRNWRESNPAASDEASATDDAVAVEDSANAKGCPKCRGIMTKYRISSDVDNRVDFCARCEDVWLDDGEWELLEGLASSGHLTKIFTQPWQRKIREDLSEANHAARLADRLGDDWDRFSKFESWLQDHDAKGQILAYLQRK